MKHFYRHKEWGQGSYSRPKKSSLVIARLLSLRGWQGPSGRVLTSADQGIPD